MSAPPPFPPSPDKSGVEEVKISIPMNELNGASSSGASDAEAPGSQQVPVHAAATPPAIERKSYQFRALVCVHRSMNWL